MIGLIVDVAWYSIKTSCYVIYSIYRYIYPKPNVLLLEMKELKHKISLLEEKLIETEAKTLS